MFTATKPGRLWYALFDDEKETPPELTSEDKCLIWADKTIDLSVHNLQACPCNYIHAAIDYRFGIPRFDSLLRICFQSMQKVYIGEGIKAVQVSDKFANALYYDNGTGALVWWLKLPAWKFGYRGFEPHFGRQISKKQNVSSTAHS